MAFRKRPLHLLWPLASFLVGPGSSDDPDLAEGRHQISNKDIFTLAGGGRQVMFWLSTLEWVEGTGIGGGLMMCVLPAYVR